MMVMTGALFQHSSEEIKNRFEVLTKIKKLKGLLVGSPICHSFFSTGGLAFTRLEVVDSSTFFQVRSIVRHPIAHQYPSWGEPFSG